MGQQQLLLVILVTIVVGIATIVAVNVLNSRVIQANRDAVRQDLLSASSFVQTVWEKPTFMGGANKRFQENLTDEEILQFLNVPASEYQPGDSEATNANGTYSVEIQSDTELIIKGEPESGPPELQVTVKREDNGQWSFELSEVGEDDSGGGGDGGPQRGTDSQRPR